MAHLPSHWVGIGNRSKCIVNVNLPRLSGLLTSPLVSLKVGKVRERFTFHRSGGAVQVIIGIILLVLGIGRLLILAYEWQQDCRLFSDGIRTMARVTDRITYPSEDDLQTSQWKLIAEYTDGRGYTFHAKTRRHLCGSVSRELMGTELEVVYLEENPERVRFALDQEKHISYWSLIGSSVLALVGLLLVLSAVLGD
jgi:hypothetical protein